MAEVKWIKLTTDMFDNRKIKYLRTLPEGNNIVLIWVMLLTMAGRCNSNGMIFLTENIPYTPKMLADELDFEESTVQLALKALENLSMVVTNNGFFSIAGWTEHQNIEGMDKIREQNRKRKQVQRERQKEQLLLNDSYMSRDSHGTVTQCHAIDKEIEREEEREENNKKKSVKENTHTLFERLLPDYNIPFSVSEKLKEWLTYKTERKEPYKEQGMKSFLRQVENKTLEYGEQAICGLIDECMSSGWKGIIYDRLEQKKTKSVNYQSSKPQNSNNDFMNELQRLYEEC